MTSNTHKEDDPVIIVAAEELDAATAPQLEDALGRALQHGARRVIVDLADTRFIDSSGLATLVRALKRARSIGGNLPLAALQPSVRRVFELTRLDKAFDVYTTRDEAARKLPR